MASKPHPPLMKKHSQTDLVSRLKTRKVLGVGGEDDDGEVHRSKVSKAPKPLSLVHWLSFIGPLLISQVLGNEIKFALREPNGLRLWILLSAVMFTAAALVVSFILGNCLILTLRALAFPNQLYEVIFELTTTRISIRLYGGALLSISLILWNGLYTAEKAIIQWTLLTEAFYFGVQFLVTSVSLLEMGVLSNGAALLLLSEVVFLLITLSYYHQLGRRTKKI